MCRRAAPSGGRPTASGTAVVLRVIQPCMQSALRRRLVLRVTIFSPVLRSGLLNTAATKSATVIPHGGGAAGCFRAHNTTERRLHRGEW